MNWRDWVPPGITGYVKLVRARLRYPCCSIHSGHIGRNVELGTGCVLYAGCQIGHQVRVGNYSYINERSIVGSGTLGRFCSIGYDCQIGMPEHPVDRISTSPFTYGGKSIFGHPCDWSDYPAPPVIGNDVWIGSRAIVLQGTRIGDGAIIAAGAVVTRDVDPYTIAGGVPARTIRKRFEGEVIQFLSAWKWWDRIDEDPKAVAAVFGMENWPEALHLGPILKTEKRLCSR